MDSGLTLLEVSSKVFNININSALNLWVEQLNLI